MRVRWLRRLLYIAVPVTVLLWIGFWTTVAHTVRHFYECNDDYSRLFLDQLCDNYFNGYVTGSLCEPLCTRKEIQFQKCLGHGIKLHVLQAEWNGNIIILKAPKKLGDGAAMVHVKEAGSEMQITEKEFIEQANISTFFNIAGSRYSPELLKVIKEVFRECDLLEDGILHYGEAIVCWQLIETGEYMLYSLLQGRIGIPDIYGSCGHMYAVQYAPSEPFLGQDMVLSDPRSWKFRAQLSLALLDMIESIEETPWGTLYLCDVQELNFGVVKRDGKLVGKAIDVDISWFEDAMISAAKHEIDKSCSSNEDCEFISCLVECDTTAGRCSGKLYSNNLQSLCRRIFKPRGKLHVGLLHDPPENIKFRLEKLLDVCANPGRPLTKIPKYIMTELRGLLQSSNELSN